MDKFKLKKNLSIFIEHTSLKVAMLSIHKIQPVERRNLSVKIIKAYQLREKL